MTERPTFLYRDSRTRDLVCQVEAQFIRFSNGPEQSIEVGRIHLAMSGNCLFKIISQLTDGGPKHQCWPDEVRRREIVKRNFIKNPLHTANLVHFKARHSAGNTVQCCAIWQFALNIACDTRHAFGYFSKNRRDFFSPTSLARDLQSASAVAGPHNCDNRRNGLNPRCRTWMTLNPTVNAYHA
ncbi:hypothetical protein ABY44_39400 [Burkholderia sp. ZZQ-2]|uniref:hypothetical protein n=1 Tax=Burkholderia sp. ZZQ-2 TaxID=1661766 RepID=UPI003D6EC25D